MSWLCNALPESVLSFRDCLIHCADNPGHGIREKLRLEPFTEPFVSKD